jgi:hypothetical protein
LNSPRTLRKRRLRPPDASPERTSRSAAGKKPKSSPPTSSVGESLEPGSCLSRTQKDCKHATAVRLRLEKKLQKATTAHADYKKKPKAPTKNEAHKLAQEELKPELAELQRLRRESKIWKTTSTAHPASVIPLFCLPSRLSDGQVFNLSVENFVDPVTRGAPDEPSASDRRSSPGGRG